MYLQSAEIRNFRGIRHLSVDFEKDTSVLIGENAWGKSSLLYALFMILGCGSQRLCRFSPDDLYVPIKLDFDKDAKSSNSSSSNSHVDELSSNTSVDSLSPHTSINASVSSTNTDTTDLASGINDDATIRTTPSDSEVQTAQAVKELFKIDEKAQYLKMVEDKKYRYLIYSIESSDDSPSKEVSAVVTHELYKTIQANNPSSLHNLATRVHKLGKEQRNCIRRQSSADMLKHAKDFLSEQDSLNHEARRTAQEDINFYSSDVYQEDTDTILIDLIFCETSHGVLNRIDRFEKLRSVAYESDDGRACIHYRISASEQCIESNQEHDSKSYIPKTRFITNHELLDEKGQTIEKAKDAIFDLITLNPLLRMRDRRMFNSTKESIDDPFCSCPEQSAAYEDVIVPGYDSAELSPTQSKSALSSQQPHDPSASASASTAQTNAPSAKATAASATQANASAASNNAAATGKAASTAATRSMSVAANKSVSVAASQDSKSTSHAEAKDSAQDQVEAIDSNDASDSSTSMAEPRDCALHDLITQGNESSTLASDGTSKGQACLEDLQEEISSQERQTISELFSSIEEEGGLTSNEVNEALTVLNTIASKYLTNYQSSTQIYNKTVHNHPRTAREIVSHPVSVASLSSLKKAIADSKPSSTKFLLSIIAGALLMSKGEREFDEYARPILLLEDIESRFHPTLLLNFWSILQVLPIQKIVTTNSSQLISAISLHNLRRLCKQYYDVRCYKVRDRAFSADDERKISFHVRMSRPASVFARCWILVEGETEVWMLNEIASVLGINLGCNGIKLIEFAQCGLNPLIKLARQLGIAFHVLTDGDTAGQHYASTVREFTGGRHLKEHLSIMPHVDIEHYLYASGFADVYQKAAGLTTKQVSERQMQAIMDKLGVAEIIAMANGGHPYEQIADTAACNLEQASPDPYRKEHYANAKASSISRSISVHKHGNNRRPRPPQNHNLDSIIASIANVNFGSHTQLLQNVIHRGKTQGKGKNAFVFDIKELTVNDVQMLYKYLRSLVADMPRPGHNFTAKQSRMLKAIKAVCGILSGIANTNKQRFASRLRKYERQKSHQHYKANSSYIAHAHANEANTYSQEHEKYEEASEPIAIGAQEEQEITYTSQELEQNLDKPSLVEGTKNLNTPPQMASENVSSSDNTDSSELSELLSASSAHDNKEALLKIKAMADEVMMNEGDHNRVKQYERSTGKAINAIFGALNDQELQRQSLNMNKVIDHAIKKNTKPGMAILVSEAMQKRGKDSVPLMFKTMFRQINSMTGHQFDLK